MKIKILASGSDGNCYIIDDGKTNLMIECGLPIREIKEKTNFFERMPDGCLVSHSHNDHALSIRDIARMGIPVYTSMNTKMDLNFSNAFVHTIMHNEVFTVGTFKIRPLKLAHDVYCLGFLIYSENSNERLFFATDTYLIKYALPPVEYIMVEANYDLEIMNERIRNGDTDMVAKERLIRSHMEINSTLRWLANTDLSRTKRIYLLHLSDGSSNEKEFKRKVTEATGIPVTVC